MAVRVITPPQPIVVPGDVPGTAPEVSLIQAVTDAIAAVGTGWLGRSLGPQTLRLTADCWKNIRLPYPPVISVNSVRYLDAAGDEQTVAGDAWRLTSDNVVWFSPDWSRPSLGNFPDPVIIDYQAGYDDTNTGPVPEAARRAIILTVQHLRDVGAQNLFLRTQDIPGVERRDYIVSDQAGQLIRDSCERLLSGLRITSL